MNKIYLLLAVVALVCGAYFYGANVADAKCRAKISAQRLENLQNIQNELMKNKKENHEIAYKTAVHDVRRILRDKYTIAE